MRTAPSRTRLRTPFERVIASGEKTSPSDLNKKEPTAQDAAEPSAAVMPVAFSLSIDPDLQNRHAADLMLF
jgi:hypothetical protein